MYVVYSFMSDGFARELSTGERERERERDTHTER